MSLFLDFVIDCLKNLTVDMVKPLIIALGLYAFYKLRVFIKALIAKIELMLGEARRKKEMQTQVNVTHVSILLISHKVIIVSVMLGIVVSTFMNVLPLLLAEKGTQHGQEETRSNEELNRRSETLREAKDTTHEIELAQGETEKPKLPAMSDEEFMELCASGNAAKVEEAIQNGANINAKDGFHTALMLAVDDKHIETVKLLIQNGANIHAKDHNGTTALIMAAWDGSIETVKLLIQNGANVNARDNYGHTALMRAAWHGSTETVKFLIKSGATVNARDNKKRTALTWAANDETKKLLRSYGAKE